MSILNAPIFTVRNLLTVLLVFSFVLFPFYVRFDISSELAYINVPFYFALVLLINECSGEVGTMNMLTWSCAVCIYLSTEAVAGVSAVNIIKFFFLYCAPLLVCQLGLGAGDGERFARLLIQAFNIGVLIVFAILILDLLTGSSVMRVLSAHFATGLSGWVLTGVFERHVSIWGHFLTTAGFYIAFLFFNVAYAKIEGEYLINVKLLYVVATLGVLSTGGKTAIVIYLVSIIWINLTSTHGVRNAAALTIFLLVLFHVGAFDIVLERFGAADLSSGRNESTEMMLAIERPGLFSGYGENFTNYAYSLIGKYYAAMFMEYSLLTLSYKFGLVFVALECVLLLWPAFSIARATGKWIIAFMGVMLLTYFSTFNGLAGVPDIYLLIALYGVCLNSMKRGMQIRAISKGGK